MLNTRFVHKTTISWAQLSNAGRLSSGDKCDVTVGESEQVWSLHHDSKESAARENQVDRDDLWSNKSPGNIVNRTVIAVNQTVGYFALLWQKEGRSLFDTRP